jgi:hypothetical protein
MLKRAEICEGGGQAVAGKKKAPMWKHRDFGIWI